MFERTQRQSDDQQHRARELSRQDTRPPAPVPGYKLSQYLGSGAFGEVWIGEDLNTGRTVAVKFYHHQGGLDWPRLSREVEKLVLLSTDRYIVQLLDVGWESEPPYYVMEYIENGSLEQHLENHGAMPLNQAVSFFKELTVGLMHAHGKGVLHCDLKPANVLLDVDHKPRLCDFGQSRLSYEQTPSLGTLFYMAPEQADLQAIPDARWDVYGLGAIFYSMLTGHPPHRDDKAIAELDAAETLTDRLKVYQQLIHRRGAPRAHRKVTDIDRQLIDVIDHCLAADPNDRFANVQEIINAMADREITRARRPLVTLGILGPLLLILIMGLFTWRGVTRAVADSDEAVIQKVQESNRFAAQYVAARVASEIDKYFSAVEEVAKDPEFVARFSASQNAWQDVMKDADVEQLPPEQLQEYLDDPRHQQLQQHLQLLLDQPRPTAASWFVCNQEGTQLSAVFNRATNPTIGRNYSWRTYFHGGPRDFEKDQRSSKHVGNTHLSALLKSTATETWKVAVSTPVYADDDQQSFLGIVVLTFDVGKFVSFFEEDNAKRFRFAVLVDNRPGDYQGVILQHPFFRSEMDQRGKLPGEFRVDLERVGQQLIDYRDPVAESSAEYQGRWIAAKSDVTIRDAELQPTGLVILIQELRKAAVAPVQELGSELVRNGLLALAFVVAVVVVLWYVVVGRVSRQKSRPQIHPTDLHELSTLQIPNQAQHFRNDAQS